MPSHPPERMFRSRPDAHEEEPADGADLRPHPKPHIRRSCITAVTPNAASSAP